MSRLSADFEALTGHGSLPTALEDPGFERFHIVPMSIMLGRDSSPSALEASFASIEPLPHIDYHLIHTLLNFCCGGRANKREMKRYDYLIDARKSYFQSHRLFTRAFNGLQDAYAYGLQLEHKKMKLEKSGSGKVKDLEIVASQIQKNYMDLNYRLGEALERQRRRQQLTAWFSTMKNDFIKSEMPRLSYVGKQIYRRNMHQEGRTVTSKNFHDRLTFPSSSPQNPPCHKSERIWNSILWASILWTSTR